MKVTIAKIAFDDEVRLVQVKKIYADPAISTNAVVELVQPLTMSVEGNQIHTTRISIVSSRIHDWYEGEVVQTPEDTQSGSSEGNGKSPKK